MKKKSVNRIEEARIFHEGIELFNSGEWFDAHEVWEDIWHTASGPKKLFYQGLIQLAVTIEHMRRGNPRGVVAVFASAQTKFVDLPDVYMGVNVRALVGAIAGMVRPIAALPPDTFEPGKSRGLSLPVNLNEAPTIELACDPFAPN